MRIWPTSLVHASTVLVSTVLAAGCSIHPIAHDVTGLHASEIVKKLQCEARATVLAKYQDFNAKGQSAAYQAAVRDEKAFKAQGSSDYDDTRKSLASRFTRLVEQKAIIDAEHSALRTELEVVSDAVLKLGGKTKRDAEIADRYTDAQMSKLLARLKESVDEEDNLVAKIRRYNVENARFQQRYAIYSEQLAKKHGDLLKRFGSLDAFVNTRIGFALKLEITESNSANLSSADFLWPVKFGSVALGVEASDKRERYAQREVRFVATFGELIENKHGCDPPEAEETARRSVSHSYPIAGDVGLAEVIEQFWQTSSHSNLDAATQAGTHTYRDTIRFTTTISGGLKPKITVAKTSYNSLVATGALSGSRVDLHEVIVTLIPPSGDQPAPATQTVNVRVIKGPDLDVE